jgi:hypothetical protein
MNELMLVALVAVIVAAYAKGKIAQQNRVAAKWGRFFDTHSIRRM